jgi:pimeloyl-ACP methyl ester carboxylesterase
MAGRVWDPVIPLLSDRHEVLAPTALGHNGGPAATERPFRAAHVIDDMERVLDEHGLDRPHIAGNSMGGWIGVELARRGRAKTVCAFSPAGFWNAGTRDQRRAASRLKLMMRGARLTRPISAQLMRSGAFRRIALREASLHGSRVDPRLAQQCAEDVAGCTVALDLLGSGEQIAPLDPVPCPITFAWSAKDGVLPAKVNGAIARERVPGATYFELQGVGHVPMIDDPQLVAETILGVTGGQPAAALREA